MFGTKKDRVIGERALSFRESRPSGLSLEPPERKREDLAGRQHRDKVVEQHGAELPAVDSDVGRSSDLLQSSVRVAVEMQGSVSPTSPTAHRVVAAEDSPCRAVEFHIEQLMHLVEDLLELSAIRVVVSADEHDATGVQSLPDPGGDAGLRPSPAAVTDEVPQMEEEVPGTDHRIAAFDDGGFHARGVREGTVVSGTGVGLPEMRVRRDEDPSLRRQFRRHGRGSRSGVMRGSSSAGGARSSRRRSVIPANFITAFRGDARGSSRAMVSPASMISISPIEKEPN